MESKDGNFTVTAECVDESCTFDRISNDVGDWTFGCCDFHLCNDENLLDLEESGAHPLSPLPVALTAFMATVFFIV